MSMAMLAGFFSVFGFGILVAFLGSIKLKLAPRIGADDAQFGKIVAVFQWTMVVMAILGGIALDALGHGLIIPMGMALSAIGIFLISSSGSIGAVMASCVVLGIGGQFINLGGNTLLPGLFEDPSAGSNLGNTFFGLGALLIPIIVASLFVRTSYARALRIVSLIMLLPIVIAAAAEFPLLEGQQFSLTVAVELLGSLVTWLAALTLFCYVGLEVSMAVWITTYASEMGASDREAGNVLSIFFVAMMASRLLFGLQDQITGIELTPVGAYVLGGAGLIAAVAITLMMTAGSLGAAKGAIALAGFVFGPIFPTTVGVTFQHFEPAQWGTLFGVIFAIGLIGASTLPAWIGKLATGKTVRSALNILRVTAVALAVISAVLGLQ